MKEDVKKIEGIMIPEECGKADNYEFAIIMYNETGVEELEKEYTLFITCEDYEDNKPYATIKANVNPGLILYPYEKDAGIGCFVYDLVDDGFVHEKNNMNAIIVSEAVNASDTVWVKSELDREVYLASKPKVVNEIDNVISIIEEAD